MIEAMLMGAETMESYVLATIESGVGLKVYDMNDMSLLHSDTTMDFSGFITPGCLFSPDGTRLLVYEISSNYTGFKLVDTSNWSVIQNFNWAGDGIGMYKFSHDSSEFYKRSPSYIQNYDAVTGDYIGTIGSNETYVDKIIHYAVSPDKAKVIYYGLDDNANFYTQVLDIASNSVIYTSPKYNLDNYGDILITDDGQYFITPEGVYLFSDLSRVISYSSLPARWTNLVQTSKSKVAFFRSSSGIHTLDIDSLSVESDITKGYYYEPTGGYTEISVSSDYRFFCISGKIDSNYSQIILWDYSIDGTSPVFVVPISTTSFINAAIGVKV